jgi:hypothetical protein
MTVKKGEKSASRSSDAPAREGGAPAALRLDKIAAQVGAQKYPPVNQWNPEFCGDMDMRIASDGTWFYMGTPIGRKEMTRLFSSILRRDEDGKYYLVTPVEKIGIQVDDAPLVAVAVNREGEGEDQTLTFRTGVGDLVTAGPEFPIRVETNAETGEPRPYVLVRDRLEALINRPVFYELVAMAVPGSDGGIGLWSGGVYFRLGDV